MIVNTEKYSEGQFCKFQNINNYPKITQNQNFNKIKQSHKDALNEKKSENRLQLEMKNIKNDIF